MVCLYFMAILYVDVINMAFFVPISNINVSNRIEMTSFGVGLSAYLRINICTKYLPLRQATKRYLACCIIFLAFLSKVEGQLNAYYEKVETGKIEIPFEYFHDFIVLDVIFQKKLPLKFILDTGAGSTVLFKKEYAELLQMPYHKKIKLLGSDLSKDVFAYVCNNTSLQLVNLSPVAHNVIVLEEDFLFIEEYTGMKVDGILGAEFFKGMIIKIDYRNKLLTLIKPVDFLPKKYKDYTSFDIDVINHKPYLTTTTEVNPGVTTQTRLLIDTGAAITALFHDNTDSTIVLKSQVVKGNLGAGLGGNIEGYSGKIHRLHLGPYQFNNMISSFQSLDDAILNDDKIVRNGLLGNLLLERFQMILDFHHKKLYLKPYKNYNKEFEFDKSGLTIFAFGQDLNQFYVKHVIDGSPADEAGILPGDIILKVGYWSYRWFDLRRLNKKLSGKVGKTIHLRLKREGQIINTSFVLRDLFT